MSSSFLNTLYFIIVLFIIMIATGIFYIQYKAVLKYYPDISFIEYVILCNKIRITPE